MKTFLFILGYMAIMAACIFLMWMMNRIGYDAGYKEGIHTKGIWIKEVRTHIDTIYHFKPE